MARLIYAAITSLDGYVADEDGGFAWAAPDAQVHAAVNELERPIGTYLYGRRMYEVMTYWETIETTGDGHPVERDFAGIWQGADKVVFSRALDAVTTARTRLERAFDPGAVRGLVDRADRDVSIGGAQLAGQALAAGLVDEVHLYLTPVIVGTGTHALPRDVRLDLRLLGHRRFDGGVVHLHYATR